MKSFHLSWGSNFDAAHFDTVGLYADATSLPSSQEPVNAPQSPALGTTPVSFPLSEEGLALFPEESPLSGGGPFLL
ncbi:hypothetical protein Nepgr_006035 [Nepenthes gracilis]|uniref:Uncharacterized protein n=1 Tax=Nepenthes gracilis TaxID=150966 RepID=A0AAD3S4H4_NEPGR|nr:hypothetical protein Nepgr_006035 [Nepenthes gracilis]